MNTTNAKGPIRRAVPRLLGLLRAIVLTMAAPLSAQPTDLIGPGVSSALATARRTQLSDVRYALRLDVGDTGTADQATGTVTITFRRRGAGDVILDFRGRSIGGAIVNGVVWPEVAAHWNRHHLVVPASRLRAGENRVVLGFTTPIASAGAAIIRSRDAADSSTYLYTLLVPADANLLFPCFDQPDLKARVSLMLTTPPGWTAVANGARTNPLLSDRSAIDMRADRWVHRFRETAPISTYLVAFAAGPWHTVTASHVIRPGGAPQPMSLYARRSRAAEVDTDSLLAMNARALRWLGGYFGAPYAFGKYDFVLAPAFPFGGMEHPGAVFYNEDSFVYREQPTTSQLLGRQATTYHEVAHQWFGDFVTMQWFDDLWLKEGFATFMAARMQAALEPSANAWKTFYLRNKPVAYGTDATLGTTPVWQALGNLDQAKSNYGPIVYNKAPSILRQLEFAVGEAAFQRGVRAFLATHRYGNATWRSLLSHIGRAAGRDLTSWGAQWMLRPGMPIVTQELTVRDGRITALRLLQRPAQPTLSGRGAWPLALEVLLHYPDGRTDRLPVQLTGDTTRVRAAEGRPSPSFVFANHGDYGYAIVLPDSLSLTYLEQHIGDVRDDLLRPMLWGALWDLVRDAAYDPRRYLAMIERELPRERDEQIAGTLLGRLSTVVTRYLPAAERDAMLPRVGAMLLAGARDTAYAYSWRKAHLDTYIGLATSAASQTQLRRWLQGDSIPGLPLRAPTRWAMVTRLIGAGAPDADSLLAAETLRDATSEGRRQAFVAAAARPDSGSKARLFARWFADTTLNEEWVTSSLRAFHDPAHADHTLPYLIPALDTLPWIQQNRRIFFLGSWLGATLGGQRSPTALERVDQWLAAHPSLAPDLRQKVLQARDELDRTVRIQQHFTRPLP